ncbi:OmpA family protein [Dyadobacter subterraneus]|uniref:OmpA family protein n=1 Tax=Dyadobacter subterraneus TaxID=2773304 RepID=A0ABR9W6N9_9BACT|nr:OmpA family protein [Dyadobacter subterraneus]MBE9461137.1 OmpA family protein [Dyadobacter subterraneus]
MAVNLLELTKGYITKEVGLKISDLTQESTSDVQIAMLGALPGLIGGIMNKASTVGGVHELIGLINLNNEDYVLNGLGSILGDESRSKEFISNGLSLLPILLDLDLKTVTDSISSSSGIKSYSVSTILSICAPIVLSVVAKYAKVKGVKSVEPVRLTSLLVEQKEFMVKFLPKDLNTLWNFKELEDLNKSLIRNPLSESELEGKPLSRGMKIFYWILFLLILGGAFYGYKKLTKEEETVVVEDFPVGADSVGNSKGTSKKTLGQFVTRQLPKDISLNIPENGIEAKLANFIADSSVVVDKDIWFDFDRVTFEPSAANLSQESMEQIDNIAKILRAYPNVNIKIGGYTDNTGDAATNLSLSKSRADAVRRGIVNKGIKATRISSEGYGIEHPVADNNTEEGRAQNRRIAINVTRK